MKRNDTPTDIVLDRGTGCALLTALLVMPIIGYFSETPNIFLSAVAGIVLGCLFGRYISRHFLDK